MRNCFTLSDRINFSIVEEDSNKICAEVAESTSLNENDVAISTSIGISENRNSTKWNTHNPVLLINFIFLKLIRVSQSFSYIF